MAYTPTRLYQGQLNTLETTSSPGILSGAVPSATTWIVKEIIICNTSTTQSATVSLSIVPSGGTGGTSNRILSTSSVDANATVSLGLSTVMTVGDFITGVASLSGTVTVTISGVVIT